MPRPDSADPIRTSVAFSRLDHVRHLRLRGEAVGEAFDRICPTEMKLRDGQIMQSLLLDDEGRCIADLVLGMDEEDLIVLAEGPAPEDLIAHLREHLGDAEIEIEDRSATHGILSLDGPYAWELLGLVVGDEAIGLPYLTFFHLDRALCYRAGKTGEFGYGMIAPHADLEAIENDIRTHGAVIDLGSADIQTLDRCALENGFFNVRYEGSEGLTPLELQLQWRVSYRKEFVGSRRLGERRRDRVRQRVVSLAGSGPFAVGEEVALNGAAVGRILNAAFSPAREDWVALALLDVEWAHPGISELLVGGAARAARSLSTPLLNNRSLFVSPQLHSYGTRHEYTFPPVARQ